MKLELLMTAKEKPKHSLKEEKKKNCIYPHIILISFNDFLVKKISIFVGVSFSLLLKSLFALVDYSYYISSTSKIHWVTFCNDRDKNW
jgi:hypothetical protein